MKKIFAIFMIAALLPSVSACGNNTSRDDNSSSRSLQSEEDSASEQLEEEKSSAAQLESDVDSSGGSPTTKPDENNAQALIVYFSWGGNTGMVASEIQNQTGADIFELVPETPYTEDYNALLDIAGQEQADNARPAIAGSIDTLDHYDVIYVGFPNWWADMPMILYSFFDDYDLSGKTIAPFCTSGGSGFSGTITTIRNLEPEADVLEGLHIGSTAASNPAEAVTEWLAGLGFSD